MKKKLNEFRLRYFEELEKDSKLVNIILDKPEQGSNFAIWNKR